MDKYGCSICDSVFDTASHRPRSLPCGHGFCTQCIEACIRRGNNFCPVCKKGYWANSAKSLPVNYLLEDILQKAAVLSSQNQSHTEDMISMCPKHRRSPLYFLCKTHSIQVCRSCTVKDHPRHLCNLISLHEEIKKKKDLEILSIQKQKQALVDFEVELNLLDRRIIGFICEHEKKRKQIEDVKKDSQKKQKQFELIENNLRVAADIKAIEKQCKISAGETLQSQKWEEILRKELNLIKKNPDKYVMLERRGTFRSCKVLIEEGKTLVPNLSCEVKPPSSAHIIREAELQLRSGSHAGFVTVFMDINACGCNLGRVYINVFANRPYGQQFVMLALGSKGPTFKGASFQNRWGQEMVGLLDYVEEDNSLSNMPLLGSLKEEYFETPCRGMLFPYQQEEDDALGSFMICTKDTESRSFGYFGTVISGMEVIDRIGSTKFKIKSISIRECGIVLNN